MSQDVAPPPGPLVPSSDQAHPEGAHLDAPQAPKVIIEFQGVSKEVISKIWEALKAGELPEGPTYTLARSMADHPHWFPLFETIGIFEGDDEGYPGEVDPFLHVNLHMLVGLQILNARPQEAQGFYIEREKMGDSPHEIVHMMINTFQRHLVWTAIHGGPEGQVDMDAYEETLRVLKPLDRDDLWVRLGHETPPDLHPEARGGF